VQGLLVELLMNEGSEMMTRVVMTCFKVLSGCSGGSEENHDKTVIVLCLPRSEPSSSQVSSAAT
jgi:hypothetical protein